MASFGETPGSSGGFGGLPTPNLGAAVSDIGSFFGSQAKGIFDVAEQQSYEEAARLARQNEQFTKMSTDIQEAQANRQLLLTQGKTQEEVASAGFSLSGSALDIMRSSAEQGALQKAVIGQQGLITEAGYESQAQSYDTMARAAGQAAGAEKMAGIMDLVGAGLSLI